MTEAQVNDFAGEIADLAEDIESFFMDPDNQKEFEVWLNERNMGLSERTA